MGGSTKDHRDIYYRQSKVDGYRARSAYKLLQIDELFGLLQCDSYAMNDTWSFDEIVPRRRLGEEQVEKQRRGPGPSRVVDLCAAPGSWSQVLTQKLSPGARIVAVDLQPMAPIAGVVQVLGDITTQETANEVVRHLHGEGAELIVCDGAPDVTGVHDLDEKLHAQLMLAALQIVLRVLERGGTFVAKIFTRQESGELLTLQFRQWFADVSIVKPRSSRAASAEHFLVCRNFSPPPGFDPIATPAALASGQRTHLARELGVTACGDLSGYD